MNLLKKCSCALMVLLATLLICSCASSEPADRSDDVRKQAKEAYQELD